MLGTPPHLSVEQWAVELFASDWRCASSQCSENDRCEVDMHWRLQDSWQLQDSRLLLGRVMSPDGSTHTLDIGSISRYIAPGCANMLGPSLDVDVVVIGCHGGEDDAGFLFWIKLPARSQEETSKRL